MTQTNRTLRIVINILAELGRHPAPLRDRFRYRAGIRDAIEVCNAALVSPEALQATIRDAPHPPMLHVEEPFWMEVA